MAIVLTAEGREKAHKPRGRRFKSCPRCILERMMALHVCTTLGDALWRSEADLPLLLPRSGGGTPADYVDELATPLTTVDAEKSILVSRQNVRRESGLRCQYGESSMADDVLAH